MTLTTNSLILEDISRAVTEETSCPVMFRALVPCNSTIVVLDVYGEVTDNSLTIACGGAVAALSVLDADFAEELDDTEYIHIRPAWTLIATGANPPDEILIRDTSEDLRTSKRRSREICGATTRTGNACKNVTRHISGSCWRHRMGK